MRMFQIFAITFIAAVIGIVSTNSFLSSTVAQPIVGVITYCHNEKSGTNFIGPCPGQSAEHNTKNLQQKTCVPGPISTTNCPSNFKHRGK